MIESALKAKKQLLENEKLFMRKGEKNYLSFYGLYKVKSFVMWDRTSVTSKKIWDMLYGTMLQKFCIYYHDTKVESKIFSFDCVML